MSKIKSNKLQKRDWAIIFLFLVTIATNWVWYQYNQTQEITNKNNSSTWLGQQVQINNLKSCIDEGTKPCNLNPTVY